MTPAIITAFAGLLASACVAVAQPRFDDGLLVAARNALPDAVSTNEMVSALGGGLWNSNRMAVATVITRPKASIIFVFLRETGGRYLAVDVSAVEGGNLGKLGTGGRARYDRVETTPIAWLHREDGMFQVVMRTRAWQSGRRYTVSEQLLIRADGTPLWR